MKRLLFISHDASRSGAPILLCNLIKWLVDYKGKNFKITLLVVKEGPLIDEFKKYVDVKIYNRKYNSGFGFVNSLLNKRHIDRTIRELNTVKWDLIFSNSIINGKIIELLNNSKTPIISYIHELSYSINYYETKGCVEGTILNSDFFICGSKMVQDNLVHSFKIDPLKMEVVNSFAELKNNKKNPVIADKIKKDLSLPTGALIVGMMGNLNWRKGPEFFVETAAKLSSENIFFVWVGASNQDYINKINYDLEKSNKKIKIKFIAPTPDFSKYFNIIDLFFLSSREDPYPMVIIESTSYGIPIICFESAGGTEEFIDDKIGFVIPYGNTQKAAEKIQYFNSNRNLLETNSDFIKNKSIKNHDIDTNAPKIFDIIENLIQK